MNKCKINFYGLYLGFNQARVGGYSTIEYCKGNKFPMKGMSDFVEHEKIIDIAKKNKIKTIHLAGNWDKLGHKGYGELVSVKVAEKLTNRLKEIL